MTHLELNLLLQECPESPYFGRDDLQTSEDEARDIVLRLVERSMFGNQEPHLEVSASKEQSNASCSLERREFEAIQRASGSNDEAEDNQIQAQLIQNGLQIEEEIKQPSQSDMPEESKSKKPESALSQEQ